MDRRLVMAVSFGVLLAGCVRPEMRSSYDPFSPPKQDGLAAAPAPAQLPHLAGPITVDGQIGEWQNAISFPLRSPSQFVQIEESHAWNGPADLSAEFYSGWTEQGLAIAGVIRDDDVMNKKAGTESWQNDCIELFVDGRADATFMDGQFGKGAYHFFVRPPLGEKPAELVFANGGAIEGIQLASAPSAGGYTFEVLIPWVAFPNTQAQAGRKVALAFQVDEVDGRDAKGQRTVTLAVPTRDDLYRNTAGLAPFALVEKLQPGGNLGPAITINVPGVIGDTLPSEISVVIGRAVADQVKRVRLSNQRAGAGGTMSGPVQIDADGDGIALAPGPVVALAYKQWPTGYSMLRAEALDESGHAIGYSTRPMVNAGNVVGRSITQVQAAGIPVLAQREPYRAMAWLGAAATIDRLKTAIARERVDDVGRLVHEVQTRIYMLQWGIHPEVDRTYMHDLLVLGYRPEAQVIVEYPATDKATVVFNCGAVPVANVVVQQFASDAAARAALQKQLATVPSRESESFRGKSKYSTVWTSAELVEPATLDMHEDLLMLDAQVKDVVYVVSPEVVQNQLVDAVVIAPRAHSQPAKVAAVYAEEHSVPTVTLDDLGGARRVLIAGDIRNEARFAKMRYARVFARQGAAQLFVQDGRRLLKAVAPTVAATEQAMRLVQRGRPVSETQANWLRREVVQGVDRTIKAQITPMLCGDVHMHSFYSDGRSSPAGLMLEAMYSLQDFSVMSDHNTRDGALRAQKLLSDAGFNYPLIVGEEVTLKYHSNVFPANRLYPWDLEPQELTKQAHADGAFVQWNHPGYPDWGREYLAKGMGELGFDAWEHLPARYDAWREAGSLPLITGSTDTHSGTFGEYPERTVVFTQNTSPEALVATLKSGEAVALLPDSGQVFVGQPQWERRALASLADGGKLKQAKAQRIREVLRSANVGKLLNASETRPVKAE